MANQPDSRFFLPPLNDNARVKPGNVGEWAPQAAAAGFAEVADSLALSNLGNDVDSISAIPDMWARPLLVEMVLKNKAHPLHPTIKGQWQGMLAAIALAKTQNLKLKAELLDLNAHKGDQFVSSLLDLIPAANKAIYQLDNGQKNPWSEIYLFSLSGRPVGMTSPVTLVCPAEAADWTGVPWVSERGQLLSPISNNWLTEDEKIQLWHWLNDLWNELQKHSGDNAKIRGLVNDFKDELAKNIQSNPANTHPRPRNSLQHFGVPLDRGALVALNQPIEPKPQPSNVKLISQKLDNVLFIPNIADLQQQWRYKQARDIWIFDTNLVAFDLQQFKSRYKGEYITPDDIFLENLYFYFLKETNQLQTNQLPGAVMPAGTDDLRYVVEEEDSIKDYNITPLLPLKPKLLTYFTAQELRQMVTMAPVNIGPLSGVRVSIALPLSGGTYTLSKDYPLEAGHVLTELPYLEIWPNFRAPGWQEYYAFYYFDQLEDPIPKTFQVYFVNTQAVHPTEFKFFRISRLTAFPEYIVCQNWQKNQIWGLILLKTPPQFGDLNPQTWRVGVDRGTSFTNVYYKSNNQSQALPLSDLNLQVTGTVAANRIDRMYEHFMWPETKICPISSILTVNGNFGTTNPIFDGRIYIPPSLSQFDPKQNYIKTELKWSTPDIPYQVLFLKHLGLAIAAEAAKQNVRNIEWTISYPAAFSRNDKSVYFGNWDKILQDLNASTGISHQWLPQQEGEHYRSESVALAHYFAEIEQQDLLSTTCIDMGGGTSDISIWVGNRLIHQCSVQVAGKHLFSQFMKQKTKFVKDQFGVDVASSAQVVTNQNPFYAHLDAVLREKSQDWLKNKRQLLGQDPDLEQIIQRAALGIAGLYYYVGMLLQSLYLEKKYDLNEITPVYIGGNGARILHWLAPSGRFNDHCEANLLFSRMLSKGSGFKDIQVPTRLSQNPKAEVACGLIADQQATKLRGQPNDECPFAGEDCYVNGQLISWTQRLQLPDNDNVRTFELPHNGNGLTCDNLQNFLDEFHNALRDLRITSIKPLPEYQANDDNKKAKLWFNTKRKLKGELLKMTGQINDIRLEPPFILGLKSLLSVLASQSSENNHEQDN